MISREMADLIDEVDATSHAGGIHFARGTQTRAITMANLHALSALRLAVETLEGRADPRRAETVEDDSPLTFNWPINQRFA